jgi:hypothetical protein
MRKLIMKMSITVGGFVSGANGPMTSFEDDVGRKALRAAACPNSF